MDSESHRGSGLFPETAVGTGAAAMIGVVHDIPAAKVISEMIPWPSARDTGRSARIAA